MQDFIQNMVLLCLFFGVIVLGVCVNAIASSIKNIHEYLSEHKPCGCKDKESSSEEK